MTRQNQAIGFILLAIVLRARPAYAFLGGAGVKSLWAKKAVVVDGQASEWAELPVVEESGLSFRAMNDADSLYLLIRGTNSEGRPILAGTYRQDVTLWFLKSDHKTKQWGINLDFGRSAAARPDGERPSPTETVPTLASLGIMPEMVVPRGLEVSTAPFPSGVNIEADLSSQRGRQPVYEIRVPLSSIQDHKNQAISLLFTSAEISPEVKAEIQAEQHAGGRGAGEEKPAGGPGNSGGGRAGGGRHRRGMGGNGGGAASSVELPKPLTLHFKVELASPPKHLY